MIESWRLRLGLICLAVAAWTSAAPATQLLSIKMPERNPDSYVSGFQIRTWGINILAICKLPVGWMVTAGRELNPGGQIVGSASGFMTNLDAKQFGKLRDFVLIDDMEPPHERSPTEPAAFSGVFIRVGEYSKSATHRDRRIRLKRSDIVLKPATQCPAPTSD